MKNEACLICPEGGICRGGSIVGTLPGYWRPNVSSSDIIFYPCHRGNPSSRERESALEACPGDAFSINPSCGIGYEGPRCLECSNSYGTSGPFCQSKFFS